MKKRNGNGLLKDIAYGMIGGAIGTLVLERVANLMYKFESEEKKKKEEHLRKEVPPEALARRISEDVLGIEISSETKSKLGQAIHWGTGIAFGGLYGVLHDRVPTLSKAAGLPFGAAFSLVVDEGLNTALKITPPPQEFPIDAHVRGLVAHLAYAASADGVFHLLRKVAG
ncbi:MAG TPA: DUF1440 domain-containing protein [Blastocatellia bacterium]|nr:DUF1440 domain-containing protein [Blastocatellia bacterium]